MNLFRKAVSSLKSINPFAPAARYLRSHPVGLKRWGWRAGATGASVLIVLLIHRSICSFVTARPAFAVKQDLSRVDVSPTWADPRSGEGRVNFRVDGAEWNLFDETLVARIGKSFEENAWVRKVTAVERVFPDRIAVKFDVRKPQLAVQKANGTYLVDEEGVRLPGVYPAAPDGFAVVRVTGATSTAPAPGQRWVHSEVAAALEMARVLASDPVFARAAIASVDVSNVGGRVDRRKAEICLVSANGCSVEWGRLPSTPALGEVPLADKLANFRAVLETYPGLDDRLRVKLYASAKGEFPPTVARENQAAIKPRK